jgi:DNA-binding transcriptional ArsR family regulator
MFKINPCCPFAVPQMAEPSKRKIYEFLALEGEKTVGEITKKLRLRQPTVSYHLKMMKKEGILEAVKKGREVFYKVKLICPEGGACFGK